MQGHLQRVNRSPRLKERPAKRVSALKQGAATEAVVHLFLPAPLLLKLGEQPDLGWLQANSQLLQTQTDTHWDEQGYGDREPG